MAHADIRVKLRSTIQQAKRSNTRTVLNGGRTMHDGQTIYFGIDVQPVTNDGEALLLICFVAEPAPKPSAAGTSRLENAKGSATSNTPNHASRSQNEALTALNSQLQETLEKQRTTANDLLNVLYSTDVATIFLDTNFNIRFFTPATRALLLRSKKERRAV